MNFALKEYEIVQQIEIGDIEFFCYGDCPELQSDPSMLDRVRQSTGGTLKGVYDIRSSVFLKDRMDEANALQGRPCHDSGFDSVACMLFTSGSTGAPKGVLLSQYGIINNAYIVANMLMQNDRDRICAVLPLFHSFGLTCSLIACLTSNTVIHISPSCRPEDILECVDKYHCTILHAVPTIFLSLVSHPNFSQYATSQIRTSIIGGSPVIPAQLNLFRSMFPNDDFRVSYGMTETSPWVCSTAPNDTEEHLENTVGPIGPGQTAMIQDLGTGKPCPPGVSGELLLKGYNMTCGYYKLPLEQQPFDADGWLHTGDMGFLDEEGYLHLTGRKKELIIRGGENISPMEVEAAILEFPTVLNVKVVGVPSTIMGEEVVACVSMKEGASFDEVAVREWLRSRIARFKIPSYFLVYPALPTMTNGKIDAVRLRKDAAEQTKVLMLEHDAIHTTAAAGGR